MNKISFSLKNNLKLGEGSLSEVDQFIITGGYKRIGLIIDKAVKNNPFVLKFESQLNSGSKKIIKWIYDLPFEPDYNSLDSKRTLFENLKNPDTDILVSIGGGSVIDFTKGIATLCTNYKNAIHYRGFPDNLNPSIPVIACPSTLGTASEVTYNAVFTDKNTDRKLGINTKNNFPILSILDPNLIIGSPKSVMISSGLDALVHTFESFACKNSNELTLMYSAKAYELLISNLKNAILKNDKESIVKVQLGAYLAGIALMNSGSGPAGAISYPLGTNFQIPHGLAGGIILPFLINHNIENGYLNYSGLISNQNLVKEMKIKLSKEVLKTITDLYSNLMVFEEFDANFDLESSPFLNYLKSLQKAFDQNPVSFQYEDAIKILNEIKTKNYAWI